MKTIICIECKKEVPRTGANHKRCSECKDAANAIIRKTAVRRWNIKVGNYTGTGSGAHNTMGEKHPHWRGGESKFVNVLAPAYYKKVRYCERCSVDLVDSAPEFRCVHHKDHNRKNNVESNFELLCKRCHQIEHECWRNLPNSR